MLKQFQSNSKAIPKQFLKALKTKSIIEMAVQVLQSSEGMLHTVQLQIFMVLIFFDFH